MRSLYHRYSLCLAVAGLMRIRPTRFHDDGHLGRQNPLLDTLQEGSVRLRAGRLIYHGLFLSYQMKGVHIKGFFLAIKAARGTLRRRLQALTAFGNRLGHWGAAYCTSHAFRFWQFDGRIPHPTWIVIQ